MTINDLINRINSLYKHEGNLPIYIKDVVTILDQQAQEIKELKIANQNLKYQLIQKAEQKAQVLSEFFEKNNSTEPFELILKKASEK
jgi:hypothetical protein